MSNEEDESSLVNAFFLPGGILDPSSYEEDDVEDDQEGDDDNNNKTPQQDEEEATNHFAFQFHPSRNPWAEDSQPSWHPPSQQQPEAWPRPSLKQQTSSSLEDAADSVARRLVVVGNPSCESETIEKPRSPLHSTAEAEAEDSLLPLFSAHSALSSSLVLPKSRHPVAADSATNLRASNGDGSLLQPESSFRPPPGFEQQQQQSRSLLWLPDKSDGPPTDKAIIDQDSIRSDSSVPHDIYGDDDRSCAISCTSSLSASSSFGNYNNLSSSSLLTEESTITEIMNEESACGECIGRVGTKHSRGETSKFVDLGAKEEEEEEEEPTSSTRDATPVKHDQTLLLEEEEEDVAAARRDSSESVALTPIPAPPMQETTKTRTSKQQQHGGAKKGAAGEISVAETQACTSILSAPEQASSSVSRPAAATLEKICEDAQLGLQSFLSLLRAVYQSMAASFRWMAPIWWGLWRRINQMGLALMQVASIALSLCFLVCKSALSESREKPGSVLCYAILYLLPGILSRLMRLLILPHWTPHVVSRAAMYYLCFPERRRDDHEESTVDTAVKMRPNHKHHRKRSLAAAASQRFGRSISQTLLRAARLTMPMMLVLDGFSVEFGGIWGESSVARILFAFVLAGVRSEQATSTVLWLSCSVQVVLANYLPPVPALDACLILIGLASIRFARFLDSPESSVVPLKLS